MSHCPYAARVMTTMGEVLSDFKRSKKQIDFELNYIGQDRNGKLTAMHGEEEVAENKRQLCVQKLYRKNYQFMDYIICRSKDVGSSDWKSCVTEEMDTDRIETCATSDKGHELLRASFQKATELGITGSPAWLLNNRFDMGGRSRCEIKKGFCERNQRSKGCKGLSDEPCDDASAPQEKASCDSH